ncbi:hypothetical protein BXZ70DRAFT_948338 [Cristinia sonorae]|uniref:NAD(P)-binding protein n=1 Tax=Cristinia sonorae TaxID=1940300 RepID=A0A8K0XMR0_9AGAR|nr:hypothetical protein BXZ70DRAFT_948338 [Cristinia sonorae]
MKLSSQSCLPTTHSMIIRLDDVHSLPRGSYITRLHKMLRGSSASIFRPHPHARLTQHLNILKNSKFSTFSTVMSSARPILVVAGIGNGSGTGASTARLFSKAGYRVALVARNPEHLKKLADEINQSGGEAVAFPIASYSYSDVIKNLQEIKQHSWPGNEKSEIRAAVWNASFGAFKTFLDVTEEDLKRVTETSIDAPFAFSREVILAFQENSIDEKGRRGTLIFTGATASIRGNVFTSAFASGKFALRALSQSLAKEFGKQNIHVAHAIIDGGILTDLAASRRAEGEARDSYINNEDIRLSPNSIAESYLYLTNQDRSSWTWELDLRPAHEKW